MAGSRRVQSATRKAMFLSRKAAWTEGWERVIRSFTWQVRHHAAVKSIKTMRPAASWRETSSSDHGRRPRGWEVVAVEGAAVFRRKEGVMNERRMRANPIERRVGGGGNDFCAFP